VLHPDVQHLPVLAILVLGLARGAIYGLTALGLVLVYKASRVINFALGETATFAAFVAWWVINKQHQPWITGALVAVLAAAAIGYAMHRLVATPMREAPRSSVMIATLGVAFLLFGLEPALFGSAPELLAPPIVQIQGAYPVLGAVNFTGLRLGSAFLSPTYMLALLTMVVCALGLALLLNRTRFGLGVLATAEDGGSARLLGIPANRVSAFTWVIGGVLGGIAGLLIAPTQGIFFPFFFTGQLFFRGLVAAFVGGLDSLSGAILAGLLVGLLDEAATLIFIRDNGFPEVLFLLLVLLVMLLRPRGLFGSARAVAA
jgi:branched-chain amino acid transport system permease protein